MKWLVTGILALALFAFGIWAACALLFFLISLLSGKR